MRPGDPRVRVGLHRRLVRCSLRDSTLFFAQRLGFVEIHRKGSHVKMEHPDGRTVVFPFHDEIDRYTLKGALQDADVGITEFLKQIR